METADVVERIKKKLDAYVRVDIAALEHQYESDWKAIFNAADHAGVVMTSKEIEGELEKRWPDDMKDARYVQLFNRAKELWDKWNISG